MEKEKWFKEVAKRCPWYINRNKSCLGITGQHSHMGHNCNEINCAPFYMAATIISAYKEWSNDSTKQ